MKGGESDEDLLLRIDELKTLIGGEDRKLKLALWFFAVGLVTGTVGLMKGDVWAFLGAIPLVFGVGRFANAEIAMSRYRGILEEKQAVQQDRQQGRRYMIKRNNELRQEIDKLKAPIYDEKTSDLLAAWLSPAGVTLTGLGWLTGGPGWVMLGVLVLFFGAVPYFQARNERNRRQAILRVKQAVLIDRH